MIRNPFQWLKSKVTRHDRMSKPKTVTTKWQPTKRPERLGRLSGVAKATAVPYEIRRTKRRRRNALAKASRRINRGMK